MHIKIAKGTKCALHYSTKDRDKFDFGTVIPPPYDLPDNPSQRQLDDHYSHNVAGPYIYVQLNSSPGTKTTNMKVKRIKIQSLHIGPNSRGTTKSPLMIYCKFVKME